MSLVIETLNSVDEDRVTEVAVMTDGEIMIAAHAGNLYNISAWVEESDGKRGEFRPAIINRKVFFIESEDEYDSAGFLFVVKLTDGNGTREYTTKALGKEMYEL